MENERIQTARTVTAATSDSIDAAAKYLEEYRFLHRMLAMNLYEKKYALRTEAECWKSGALCSPSGIAMKRFF